MSENVSDDHILTRVLSATLAHKAFILIVGTIIFLPLACAIWVVAGKAIFVCDVTILVRSEEGTTVGANAPANAAMPTDPFQIRNEIEVLNSPALADRVITKLNLINRSILAKPSVMSRAWESVRSNLAPYINLLTAAPANAGADPRKEDALKDYQRRLSATNDGRSAVVHVQFSADDPKTALDVTTAHVEAYLASQREVWSTNKAREAALLAGELTKRVEAARAADAAIEDARRALVAGGASSQSEASIAQLEAAAVAQRASYSSTLERYNAVLLEQSAGGTASRILSSSVSRIGSMSKVVPMLALAALFAFGFPIVFVSRRQMWADRLTSIGRQRGVRVIGLATNLRVKRSLSLWQLRSRTFINSVAIIGDRLIGRPGESGEIYLLQSDTPQGTRCALAAALALHAIALRQQTALIVDAPSVAKLCKLFRRRKVAVEQLASLGGGEWSKPIEGPAIAIADLDALAAAERGHETGFKAVGDSLKRNFQLTIISLQEASPLYNALTLSNIEAKVILLTVSGLDTPTDLGVSIDRLRKRRQTIEGLVVSTASKWLAVEPTPVDDIPLPPADFAAPPPVRNAQIPTTNVIDSRVEEIPSPQAHIAVPPLAKKQRRAGKNSERNRPGPRR